MSILVRHPTSPCSSPPCCSAAPGRCCAGRRWTDLVANGFMRVLGSGRFDVASVIPAPLADGQQTLDGSGHPRRRPRSRAQLTDADTRMRPRSSTPALPGPHQAPARTTNAPVQAGFLRGPRVERPGTSNDFEEPCVERIGPPTFLSNPPAHRRRPHLHLGTRLPSLQRHRFQGQVARRRRRRLANILHRTSRLLHLAGEACGVVRDAGWQRGVLPDGKFLCRRWDSPARKRKCAIASRRCSIRLITARPHRQSRSRTTDARRATTAAPCEHGACITHSYFSSAWTTMADAAKTREVHADHRGDGLRRCMVIRHIARKVLYVDRATRQVKRSTATWSRVRADAGAVRILFNSANHAGSGRPGEFERARQIPDDALLRIRARQAT